ncbi:MAG: 50S ribosomal protein L17 [Alphaproteobacteria bacterium]|nr:50S ribosomal protein L17 [Alphaproteobacteria bacterium]MBL0718189.1 50S ribosomal protein L17 [Alphaproteobacteria bacterium]
MRHGMKRRHLSRPSKQRRALMSSLMGSLFIHEQIKTTLPKAKEINREAQKMITVAKKNSLDARRRLIAILHDKKVVTKLMDVIAPRYKDRKGGYSRVIKAGYRLGDHAPIAFVELVERDIEAKGKLDKELHAKKLEDKKQLDAEQNKQMEKIKETEDKKYPKAKKSIDKISS